MTLRDWLIQQTANSLDIPLELVHTVISFQGEDAAKAAYRYNEIEFSGFGKFIFSTTRAKNKLEGMEKSLLEKEYSPEKQAIMSNYIEQLKQRLDESNRNAPINSQGEEPPSSAGGVEESIENGEWQS